MSAERVREADPEDLEPGAAARRSPFLRDFDRIIYSSAFRRLQDKTQVFSFPASDYVRTRLTHSLEVSSVGRSLGIAVGRRVLERSPAAPAGGSGPLHASDFADVVAAACLAHDIGHPPFGHAGEEAFRHWFREDRPDLLQAIPSPEERADLECFDSNAQGFRVLTRLQFWREAGGMRLCAATLGAFSKYPHASLSRDLAGASPHREEKFGFFRDDGETFRALAASLGLEPRAGRDHAWCRHPLAFLVEAADDICYLIVDIEDGTKAKLLDFRAVEEVLMAIVGSVLKHYRSLGSDADRVAYLRSKAIGVLLEQTVEAFLAHERELLAGRFTEPLLEVVEAAHAVRDLRELCHERLYNDAHKLRVEIGGFAVVRRLLEVYTETLLAWERADHDQARLPYLHQRTLRLLPEDVRAPRDRYGWLLRVIDYVSGMTNRFAVTQFKMLRGMEVGSEPFDPGE